MTPVEVSIDRISVVEFIPVQENKNIPAIKTRKYFLLISNF